MDGDDACEQLTESIFEVIEECVQGEGFQLDPTVITENSFVSEACGSCDDDQVFVRDVDDCDDDIKKIDCNDLLDLDSLRNYSSLVIKDEYNWEPNSCEDVRVDC